MTKRKILGPEDVEYIGTKTSYTINRGVSVVDGKEIALLRIHSMVPVFKEKKNKED